MNSSKLRKWLKKVHYTIKNPFQRKLSTKTGWISILFEKYKLGTTKPQVFAYQLIGGRSSQFFPLFRDLDKSLKKSGIKINFKAYVSTTILAALLLFISTF